MSLGGINTFAAVVARLVGLEQKRVKALGAEAFQVMEGMAAQGEARGFERGVEFAEERSGGKHMYLYYTNIQLTVKPDLPYMGHAAQLPHILWVPTLLLMTNSWPAWPAPVGFVMAPWSAELSTQSGRQVGQQGPYTSWTAKREGKTVCHAFSKSQYKAAKQAIAANRRVRNILEKLQAMTLETILKKVPGVQRRK